MTTTITVSARVQGLHRWPEAPARRSYLASLHRHEFIASVEVGVSHADRDVEFHDLGEAVESLLRSYGGVYHPDSLLVDFGAQSCEHLGNRLLEALEAEGFTVVGVTISEDGQHAATVRPE